MLIVFNFGWCLVDTGRGTLYTSDATGIIFSESLKNHLYPNYEDLTDFYRVQSMRGVYIASQLMKDDSIRTVISFDRGGEWQPIKRPDGAPCKDETKVFNCTLCCQHYSHTSYIYNMYYCLLGSTHNICFAYYTTAYLSPVVCCLSHGRTLPLV